LHAIGDTGPMLYRFRLATSARAPVPYLVHGDAWALRTTIDAIVTELGSRLEFRAERLRALLVVLFSALFRATGSTHRLAPLPAAVQSRLETYIDTHLADRPSIPELAEVAGLSADYFVRRFRETFGSPPRTWLVQRRIHHAMLWLDESDTSISSIAGRLGYPDVFLFSRQFKRITGVSPRSWRDRTRGR
jgi:AraC-like DNA-binding protein